MDLIKEFNSGVLSRIQIHHKILIEGFLNRPENPLSPLICRSRIQTPVDLFYLLPFKDCMIVIRDPSSLLEGRPESRRGKSLSALFFSFLPEKGEERLS